MSSEHEAEPTRRPRIEAADDRTGMSPEVLERAVIDHLRFSRGKELRRATLLDLYHAVALATRDRLVWRWIHTWRTWERENVKRAYYLSAEYLVGRQLEHNLLALGILDVAREGLRRHGIDLDEVIEQEEDPGLGNGGLGRLAACFMESAATHGLPLMGYGIRYEFGIFRQGIDRGWQVEHPDAWLKKGNPWEMPQPEYTVPVQFGGVVEEWHDDDGRLRKRWRGAETVLGVPYDTPVAGYRTHHVHTLRLWAARASEELQLEVFNDGDYRRAVEQKALSESISKVLYPKDDSIEGKELRLRQQYFFVACSIHDILRRFRERNDDWTDLPEKVAIQLNDTHPAIAVAELMRILVDQEALDWDRAWNLVRHTVAYTNHTLLPEALETWNLDLFGRLLPRHLEIIYEINQRFLDRVHIWAPGDVDRLRRMSIIDEGPPKRVRMAHLAVIGSHAVNGVARLHSRLLRERVLADFAEMLPDQFTSITNGVTPRRWLRQCNPELSAAITRRIGEGWVRDLEELALLEEYVDDPDFLAELSRARLANKRRLAAHAWRTLQVELDPQTLFDVQVKRLHEYKRQLMVALHVCWLYWRIKFRGDAEVVPRTVLVGGKAAPGYATAKRIIKFINDVANVVNVDPALRGRLRLVFLPNYNVSYAERVIPATDLSEQISLAGKEASGTGNMKFQMNGALTMGTLDGANIEIREAVGAENFYLFGLDADEVARAREAGFDPRARVEQSEALQAVLDLVERGVFNRGEAELHRGIARYVREEDPFLITADFDDYVARQEQAARDWAEPDRWWPRAARNIARAGRFSSDRAVREYAERIWRIAPVAVELPDPEPTGRN